jgi:hypothetical protein
MGCITSRLDDLWKEILEMWPQPINSCGSLNSLGLDQRFENLAGEEGQEELKK